MASRGSGAAGGGLSDSGLVAGRPTPITHLAIGKASFDSQKLLENYAAVMDEVTKAKPASTKGRYIISVPVSTTMGPASRSTQARPPRRKSSQMRPRPGPAKAHRIDHCSCSIMSAVEGVTR